MKTSPRSSAGIRPSRGWRWARRLCQVPPFVAILLAPLLGGWQRGDRNELAAWDGNGWDLPPAVLEALPLGDAPRQAHEANILLGGGTAAEYLGVPAIDPVAGLISLLATPQIYAGVLIGWLIPLALALLAGRAFCGWMCPFGTLARGLQSGLERLPWRMPSFVPPQRRTARFVLLGLALLLGVLGGQLWLYMLLPHLWVQQSFYAIWLMGGGGAALGGLFAVLLVGVLFGPTVYCATVCPTGAALSLPGRARIVRLALVQPSACGSRCDLCDRACWLSLRPSTGDPGPDCDTCARCQEVCPRDNLRVIARTPWPRRIATRVMMLVIMLGAGLALSGSASAMTPYDPHKPRLLLDARRAVDDVEIAVAVVDLAGIRLGADDPRRLRGVELSVYVVRGPRGTPDERGRLPAREPYHGPLVVRIQGAGGLDAHVSFDAPNYPRSTPRRSIYRGRVDGVLRPGDLVSIEPIEGWLLEPQTWELPDPNAGASSARALGFGGASFLLLGGLTMLALGLRSRRDPGPLAAE